jgi:hypothetical protein
MRRAEAIERGVESSDRRLRQQRVGISGSFQGDDPDPEGTRRRLEPERGDEPA